jgi:hypothetical protein
MTTRYYEYIVEKISAAKKSADSLAATIGHAGIEGQIREIAIRECLEPFLTHSFSAAGGKIIDQFGEISDQIDLVIYQTKSVPPILINKELGIFPIECCKYVFEVKSTITATEIKDSLKKFNSIRGLKSFPKKNESGSYEGTVAPVTVLFAFSSDISGIEIDRFLKYESASNPSTIVLCVLGKGYWFFVDGKWHGEAASAEQPYREFTMFITGFMNTLAGEETTMRGFNPGTYVSKTDFLLKPVNT